MRNTIVLLFTTLILALLGGCGQAPETANVETPNLNLPANTDFSGNILTNVDPNVVNDPPASSGNENIAPFPEIQSNKVGNHVRTGEPGVDSDGIKQAQQNKQMLLGADNSFITGEMNKQGQPVQARTFVNHPLLAKVEVIALGENEKKQLVHLKDGRVLPLSEEKIKKPMAASSYDLLKAVGVEYTAPAGTEKKEEPKQKLPYGKN